MRDASKTLRNALGGRDFRQIADPRLTAMLRMTIWMARATIRLGNTSSEVPLARPTDSHPRRQGPGTEPAVADDLDDASSVAAPSSHADPLNCRRVSRDVRVWHIADIARPHIEARFWRESGRRLDRERIPHMTDAVEKGREQTSRKSSEGSVPSPSLA